jgi:CRP/FNR family transcriptional regulator, cyclic AMP receptor protein
MRCPTSLAGPGPMDRAARLRQHPVLGRLGADSLESLVQKVAVQRIPERAQIFQQGDESRSVLALADGYVKLSAVTLNGREVVLDLAGPGSVFGELAVFNGWPRTATATALSECVLLSIDGAAFSRAVSRTPEAMVELIRLLSRRLHKTTEQMTDVIDMPAAARIAKALLRLAALHSKPVPGGLKIELALSQRELGGMTGSIREIINRHLRSWRDSGWLRLSDRNIVLTNVQALRTLLHDYELCDEA